MKIASLLFAGIASIVWLNLATPALAAEEGDAHGKEVTISGDAKCAKCALKETEKCQGVIEAENKKGKAVKYYLANNDVSKEFHKNICSETKKVTATGTAKKVDGKWELTAKKIELAK